MACNCALLASGKGGTSLSCNFLDIYGSTFSILYIISPCSFASVNFHFQSQIILFYFWLNIEKQLFLLLSSDWMSCMCVFIKGWVVYIIMIYSLELEIIVVASIWNFERGFYSSIDYWTSLKNYSARLQKWLFYLYYSPNNLMRCFF
jgi:hypothetical protein